MSTNLLQEIKSNAAKCQLHALETIIQNENDEQEMQGRTEINRAIVCAKKIERTKMQKVMDITHARSTRHTAYIYIFFFNKKYV